jgi:hypothetical protein
MPPRIDVDPYKDEILNLISQKTTHDTIRALLQQKYNIKIGRIVFKESLNR